VPACVTTSDALRKHGGVRDVLSNLLTESGPTGRSGKPSADRPIDRLVPSSPGSVIVVGAAVEAVDRVDEQNDGDRQLLLRDTGHGAEQIVDHDDVRRVGG
jgi:hypothetical protein